MLASMSREDEERLTLIERGLAEAAGLIQDLRTPKANELRERLSKLMRGLEVWATTSPSRIERAAMVNSVLELNLDALKLRRESK